MQLTKTHQLITSIVGGYIYGKLFNAQPTVCAAAFLIVQLARQALCHYLERDLETAILASRVRGLVVGGVAGGATERAILVNKIRDKAKVEMILVPIATVAYRQLGIIGNLGTGLLGANFLWFCFSYKHANKLVLP